MPIYSYRAEDGELTDVILSIKDAKQEIVLEDGRKAKKVITCPSITGTCGAGFPYACKGSSVHPSQREELATFLKDSGVPTQVNKLGQPIYENMHHQKKALAARGMVDLDGN